MSQEVYIFTAGNYSVFWASNGFEVIKSLPGGSTRNMGTRWADDAAGCGFAVGYARFLHENDRYKQDGTPRTPGRALAVASTEEGARLFALGRRKAHKEWIDA